jgi:hypothetical protein
MKANDSFYEPTGMAAEEACTETPARPEALIGTPCWDGGIPQGLAQLEQLVGNATNPKTFCFNIRYERIRGANFHPVLENPSLVVLKRMVAATRAMAATGVKAVTTSCGFNAIFQKELADSVDIPVFTSSRLKVPLAACMLKAGQKVGILTARKRCLTEKHLQAVGIGPNLPITIEGVEDSGEWDKVFHSHDVPLDIDTLEREIVHVARGMIATDPGIGALVLECTDLPPFASAIRHATGRPVFDIVTLVNMVCAVVGGLGE